MGQAFGKNDISEAKLQELFDELGEKADSIMAAAQAYRKHARTVLKTSATPVRINLTGSTPE